MVSVMVNTIVKLLAKSQDTPAKITLSVADGRCWFEMVAGGMTSFGSVSLQHLAQANFDLLGLLLGWRLRNLFENTSCVRRRK